MAKSQGAGTFYVGSTALDFGTITTFEEDVNVDLVTSEDASGDVDGVVPINKKSDVSMEVQASEPGPVVGNVYSAVLQEGTKNVIIQSSKMKEANKEFKTYSIAAKRWITNDVPSTT